MSIHAEKPAVFVTGATGYIGGRLIPRLLSAGFAVRALARDAGKLSDRVWRSHPDLTIITGDVADVAVVEAGLRGCTAAYYLIHSMMAVGPAYRARDRLYAECFAAAAARSGVARIIYLGGLGETGPRLSEHLTSRREVEHALRGAGVPVTVLRAAMIIGSGSASFEILRYLVERLPVMVTPRWVNTECQPIAVRDVLHYLVACLATPATVGRTLDIGGPEVHTYRALMQIMAEARGLRRRLVIPVPVLTPRLSSLWIHLVTPVSQRIARPLAEGLRNRVVCRNDDAVRLMPSDRLTVRAAIDAALGKLESGDIETTWCGAGPMPGDPNWAGGTVFVDRRTRRIAAPAAEVYRAVCRIGGGRGYYHADWLWRLRGGLDRLIGGPGLRRGRRDPERVAYGDVLDFWRVRAVVPDRRLELRAEMRLPGEALLTFEIEPEAGGATHCQLVQTARFKPKGLAGLVYWWAVKPLHGIVFAGMLRGIRESAERAAHHASHPVGPGGARLTATPPVEQDPVGMGRGAASGMDDVRNARTAVRCPVGAARVDRRRTKAGGT